MQQKGKRKMSKKTVGIVPWAEPFDTENLYDDKYHFVNSYNIRAVEAGLIPLGILPVDKRIPEGVLNACDCFIINGGHTISPYHLEVIDHAVKTGKKVLGICLGCQSIVSYFGTAQEAEKRGWKGSIADLFVELKKETRIPFLKEVKGHSTPIMPRSDLESVKHPVRLEEGTLIRKVLGTDVVMGASMHIYAADHIGKGLRISGWSEDGIIEAVEAGDTIIGTQFHPDVDDKLKALFSFLAE